MNQHTEMARAHERVREADRTRATRQRELFAEADKHAEHEAARTMAEARFGSCEPEDAADAAEALRAAEAVVAASQRRVDARRAACDAAAEECRAAQVAVRKGAEDIAKSFARELLANLLDLEERRWWLRAKVYGAFKALSAFTQDEVYEALDLRRGAESGQMGLGMMICGKPSHERWLNPVPQSWRIDEEAGAWNALVEDLMRPPQSEPAPAQEAAA